MEGDLGWKIYRKSRKIWNEKSRRDPLDRQGEPGKSGIGRFGLENRDGRPKEDAEGTVGDTGKCDLLQEDYGRYRKIYRIYKEI
jgi:hypothetical protein